MLSSGYQAPQEFLVKWVGSLCFILCCCKFAIYPRVGYYDDLGVLVHDI